MPSASIRSVHPFLLTAVSASGPVHSGVIKCVFICSCVQLPVSVALQFTQRQTCFEVYMTQQTPVENLRQAVVKSYAYYEPGL